jgi:hypothetical protein
MAADFVGQLPGQAIEFVAGPPQRFGLIAQDAAGGVFDSGR